MKTKQINWDAGKEDHRIIVKIVKRAMKMDPRVQFLDAVMDVTACHLNGCKLKLSELFKADNFNFAHDVFGIFRNINRTNGTLDNCFLPRYASPEAR